MSGKKIVIGLFSTALILWAILFYTAWRQKQKELRAFQNTLTTAADTASSARDIRAFIDTLPRAWTRISWIKGQGWAIYMPCDSEPGTLHLDPDTAGHPQLHCEFCDSLGGADIASAIRYAWTGRLELRLSAEGYIAVERVNNAVAMRFQGAPFKNFVLTWHPRAADSMVFAPASGAGEFETLRAEDENPEGCGNGP